MKKIFFCFAVSLCLTLASCYRGPVYEVTDEITSSATTVAEETLDLTVFDGASGIESVYEKTLKGVVYSPSGLDSGLFLRIIIYDDGRDAVRLICTDTDMLTAEGVVYEISEGDISADPAIRKALREICDGGECLVGDRHLTEDERGALLTMLNLYEAAHGVPYIIDKGDVKTVIKTDTNENGNKIYDHELYSITFPASFEIELDGNAVHIYSTDKRPRSVMIDSVLLSYSGVIADQSSVDGAVRSTGGNMISAVETTHIAEKNACTYTYEKDGSYVTVYIIDGGDRTYVISCASYDKSDNIPKNIASTFKLK